MFSGVIQVYAGSSSLKGGFDQLFGWDCFPAGCPLSHLVSSVSVLEELHHCSQSLYAFIPSLTINKQFSE